MSYKFVTVERKSKLQDSIIAVFDGQREIFRGPRREWRDARRIKRNIAVSTRAFVAAKAAL